MNTNKEERKQKALEIMKELDIFEPYRDSFKNNDEVCYFENYAGFWAWQDNDFLIITDYKEEWNDLVTRVNYNQYYAFAYVWNKTDNGCSEFGTIAVKSFGGGIKRIA